MVAVSEPAIIERRRGPGRPWRPGQSGNPSGMPKEIAPAVLEARRLALSWAPKAIERLAAMLDSEDERVVCVAATALLDRAGVKPHSADGPGDTAQPSVDVDALRGELAQRLAALAPRQDVPASTLSAAPGAGDHAPAGERGHVEDAP